MECFKLPSAPNEGRNNWCHLRLQDFDFETFRDFFRLRDQKSGSASGHFEPNYYWCLSFPTFKTPKFEKKH